MPTVLMARVFGAATASGLLAVLLVDGSVPGLLFGYFAALPLEVIGLSAGPLPCLLAGMLGTVLVAVAAGGYGAGVHLLVNVLPAALVVGLTLRAWPGPDGKLGWAPPGPVLVTLTGLGLVVLAAAVLAFAGEDGGLRGSTERFLAAAAEDVGAGAAGAAGPPAAEAVAGTPVAGAGAGAVAAPPAAGAMAEDPLPAMVEIVTTILPGATVVSWLMMVIVNAAVAQALLARNGQLLRPALALNALVLPEWLASVLGIAALLSFVTLDEVAYLGINAGVVLSLPFFFGGLAVVHAVAARKSGRFSLLIAFYGCVLLLGWPVLLLIGLGVIEPWLGLRRRVAPDGDER